MKHFPLLSFHLTAALCLAGLPLGSASGQDKKPAFASDLVKGSPIPIKADLRGAKELHLVVTDGGDGFGADWANWVQPVLVKKDGTKIKLTDLKPRSAVAGWGSVQNGYNASGEPMSVQNKRVTDGIGTHAPSNITFDLPADVVSFEAQGALDDGGLNQGIGATVTFEVHTQTPPGVKPAARVAAEKPEGENKPYGFAEAAASLSSMKVADGLAVSLFAAEPQIQNPTNIDIDHRGRVWAVEAVNYRSSFQKWGVLRPAGDRVVILEDADGDGVAEVEKTFWQSKELAAPLGICVLPQERGTQVIVSAAPNVWLLTDTDGDDKADKMDKLFTVSGNFDHDHQVHAFVFGPDGTFYFNFGNEARELKGPDGKLIVDVAGNPVNDSGKNYRQGMVFRCDIVNGKALNVETLGHNFRNNYEVCVDSFGTMWQSDNDDDGNKGVRINYVMEYGNYGFTDEVTGAGWRTDRTNGETEVPKQHWHLNDPGVVPNLLQTGSGSPTGILINEGTLLGGRFTNQLIHCDAGPRVVRAYPVQPDGAGYKAEMVNILESTDQWYRPSDVAIAPDGALFIADWYDSGVGGHNMGDRSAEKVRGRIYRVAPTGSKAQVPKVDLGTGESAAMALNSPNLATRYMAWQKLRSMGPQAASALDQLAKSNDPRARARAFALLALIPERAISTLATALQDSDPSVRVAAVRLTRSLSKTGGLDTAPLESTPGLMKALLFDPNPQVRREIAISLRGAKEVATLWAVLANQHDGKDRWYLEALGIGAAGNEDACFDEWLKLVGNQWNSPAGRDIIWRMRTSKSADYLARVLQDQGTPKNEAPRYLRAFDFLPASPAKSKVLVQLASLGSADGVISGEALQRLKTVKPDETPELKQLLASALTSSAGTARWVDLVRDFKIKDQGQGLAAFAAKDPSSSVGIDAAKLLLAPENVGAAADAMKGETALGLTQALGNTGDPRAAKLLVPLLTDASKTADLRRQAVRSLAQSPAGVDALLTLARGGQFPQELRFAATTSLAAVQMPKLKDEIVKLFPAPNALGAQPLPPMAELVKRQGNAARGKELYAAEDTSCVTCHRIGQVGVDFGPGLAEIGTKLGKEALYESIIEPNAGVSMGFETTQLTMKDGSAAVGIVRSETAGELVIAMPRGIQLTYKKSDIAKREKHPFSMMPSGLQQTLTEQDLVDLVEYLATLKATPVAR